MGWTRQQLAAYRSETVADLVGARAPLLVLVGINPSLMTAATATHFAHPSNRFYPALQRAGLTSATLPRGVTHTPQQRAHLTERGIAITNIVARATARADELAAEELVAGGEALVRRLVSWSPRVIAFTGVQAYRVAFGRRTAQLGRQTSGLAEVPGAEVWVLPNPSGLNAHEDVGSLASWYGRVADAAGVDRVAVRP